MNNFVVIPKDELYHHGIKGQKWGKKNGPPYPLDASDHSSSERKEGTKGWTKEAKAEAKSKSKSNSKGSTSRNTSVKSNELTQKEINEFRKKMVGYYGNGKPEKAKEYSKMSDEEIAEDIARKKKVKKLAIAGVAALGIGAGIYLAYKYDAVDRISNMLNNGIESDEVKKNLDKVVGDSIDDLDFIFNKGHKFHRQVGFENFDLSKTAGKALYVTSNKADTAAYKAFLKDWSGTGKRYDVTLKATKAIKVPSDKKAREIFDNLIKNNDEYKKALAMSIAKQRWKDPDGTSRLTRACAEDIYNNMDKFIGGPDEIFKKGIYQIVKQDKDAKILMDEYRKAGYDAITDYFDKGTMAERPLIFFDADKTLMKKGEQFVSKTVYKKAIDYLSEAKNAPLSSIAKQIKNQNLYDIQYNSIFR